MPAIQEPGSFPREAPPSFGSLESSPISQGIKRELHMDCSLCDNLEMVPSFLLTCHCLEHSHGDTYLQGSLEHVVYLGAQEDDNTGVGEH